MQKMIREVMLNLKVRAFDDIPREIWIQFKDREDYAQKEQELLNYLRGSVGTSAVVSTSKM